MQEWIGWRILFRQTRECRGIAKQKRMPKQAIIQEQGKSLKLLQPKQQQADICCTNAGSRSGGTSSSNWNSCGYPAIPTAERLATCYTTADGLGTNSSNSRNTVNCGLDGSAQLHKKASPICEKQTRPRAPAKELA